MEFDIKIFQKEKHAWSFKILLQISAIPNEIEKFSHHSSKNSFLLQFGNFLFLFWSVTVVKKNSNTEHTKNRKLVLLFKGNFVINDFTLTSNFLVIFLHFQKISKKKRKKKSFVIIGSENKFFIYFKCCVDEVVITTTTHIWKKFGQVNW